MADEEKVKAEEQMAKLEELLSEYDKSIKLVINVNPDMDKYLNFTLDQLKNMTYEDIAAINVIVAGYAIFLQKEENRHNAKAKWADNLIQLTAANKINSYKQDFQTYEERRMLCIVDNSYMKKMNELRIKAETRHNEISRMAQQINKYADAIKDLVLSKRRIRDAV